MEARCPEGAVPWYAFEPQGCSRLECSQWEQFMPEKFLWEHHWNKCRRPDNQIHHHEFPSSSMMFFVSFLRVQRAQGLSFPSGPC